MPNENQQAIVIPTIHAVACPTRKRRGEASEAAFLARALALGLHASTPWGDSERYDILIDHGDGFWRVQVKCTVRYGEARYRVKNGGSNQQPYSPDEGSTSSPPASRSPRCLVHHPNPGRGIAQEPPFLST